MIFLDLMLVGDHFELTKVDIEGMHPIFAGILKSNNEIVPYLHEVLEIGYHLRAKALGWG